MSLVKKMKDQGHRKILISLRWTVIIVTSYLILYGQGRIADQRLGQFFVLGYILSNVLLLFFPTKWFSKQKFFYSVVLFDTGVVSLGMYLSERVTADFYMVFFLILIFALMRSFKLLIVISGATAVCYGVLLYSWGLLSSDGASSYTLRIPFIFIMAIFYGYILQVFKEESRQQLALSEDKYRGLFENANDGIIILKNSPMEIADVNREAERLTGYSKEELLRRDGLVFFRPEDREEARLHFVEVDQKGEARTDCLPFLRKDGTLLEVDLSSKRIDLNKDSFFQIIFRDLTEQRILERRIRQSKRSLEAIFDGIRDQLSLLTLDDQILRVNRAVADLYHSDYRDLLGKKCYEAYYGRSLPCEGCPVSETIRTKQPATSSMKVSGGEKTLCVFSYPILDEKGEVVFIIEHVRDITDEQRLRDEIILSEKLAGIGILASGIAHEINNPLTGIIGMAEIAMEEKESGPLAGYLKDILACGQRISEIVRGLSSYSRNARKEEDAPVDINELLDASLRIVRMGMKKKSPIEVVREFQWTGKIEANPGEIQLVFNHLVTNALQAMEEKEGKLVLATRPLKGGVEVRIGDNGGGIPSSDLPHIFDPFFTTRKLGEGRGLGLNIAYRIVAKHEGKIEAESVEGMGTTFIVQLPGGGEEG